jgi:hypothetical protein
MSRNVADGDATMSLCNLLAETGRKEEALKEVEAMVRRQEIAEPWSTRELDRAAHFSVYYQAGDLAGAEKALGRPVPETETLRFALLMDQGKPAEALALSVGQAYLASDGFHHLAASLSWRLAGNAKEADAAREQAATALVEGDGRRTAGRRAAALRFAAHARGIGRAAHESRGQGARLRCARPEVPGPGRRLFRARPQIECPQGVSAAFDPPGLRAALSHESRTVSTNWCGAWRNAMRIAPWRCGSKSCGTSR